MKRHLRTFAFLILLVSITRTSWILAGSILDSNADTGDAAAHNPDTEIRKPKRRKTAKRRTETPPAVGTFERYRYDQLNGKSNLSERPASKPFTEVVDGFGASRLKTLSRLEDPSRAPSAVGVEIKPLVPIEKPSPTAVPMLKPQPIAITAPLPVATPSPIPLPTATPVAVPIRTPLAPTPVPVPTSVQNAVLEYYKIKSQADFASTFSRLDQRKLVLVKFGNTSCSHCPIATALLKRNQSPTLINNVAVFDMEVDELSRDPRIRRDTQFLHEMFRTVYRQDISTYPAMVLAQWQNGRLVPVMDGNRPYSYPIGNNDDYKLFIPRMIQRAETLQPSVSSQTR